MKILISHIQEEFLVAMVLKKWIESAFADQCTVWASTDPEDFPTLAQWLGKNDEAATDVKVLVVLCSPNSLQRPWVSFEAGCAWARNIGIVPICLPGLTLAELPKPLSNFPGLDLKERDFSKTLISTLAKKLGVLGMTPIDYRQMREELKEVQGSIQTGVSLYAPTQGPAEITEVPLESIHVQILIVLADGYGYPSTVLSEHFKMEEKKLIPLLKRLIEGNYVYASPAGMGLVRYNVTNRGRSYLKENGLL
jgi:hypothetical protein